MKRFLRVKEVCELLGVKYHTLMRMIWRREFGDAVLKIGAQWRFDKDRLDEWIENQRRA